MTSKSITFLLLSLLFHSACWAQKKEVDCIQAVVPAGSINNTNWAREVIGAFVSHGYCIDLVERPPRRASYEFSQGKFQIEISRIPLYEKTAGQFAIMVPTAYLPYDGVLITRNAEIQSQEDINRLNEVVGYISGWLWMEEWVKQYSNPYRAKDYDSLQKAYRLGRINTMLWTSTSLKKLETEKPFRTISTLKLGVHVWVRKERSDLVEPFDKIIRSTQFSFNRDQSK